MAAKRLAVHSACKKRDGTFFDPTVEIRIRAVRAAHRRRHAIDELTPMIPTGHAHTPMRRAVECARHLAVLVMVALLGGCVSTQGSSTGGRYVDGDSRSGTTAQERVEPLIRNEVARWDGTPHVLGGSSAAGMDCSAFVQRVFANVFDLELPRTTEEQVNAGRRVNWSELQAGDLVFFQPPTKTNHVGIYLKDGEFAHVSSTDGVSISELDVPYWRTAYWTSRRLLRDDVPVAVHAPEAEQETARVIERSAPTAPRPKIQRVGW